MNLKEFSKKTGIPVSTISKALGNYKDVNRDTKNKIIALAKKYNYVPNPTENVRPEARVFA